MCKIYCINIYIYMYVLYIHIPVPATWHRGSLLKNRVTHDFAVQGQRLQTRDITSPEGGIPACAFAMVRLGLGPCQSRLKTASRDGYHT